jgi:hypothetical protein
MAGFEQLLGSYQADKSYIQDIRSFPMNVEIKTVKTFSKIVSQGVTPGNVTFELNNSIVLLPGQPMKIRTMDRRVGYFAQAYFNYDASKPVNINWIVNRRRLEPKEADIEKYKRGELVEPEKPIVYYIDPSTPKKWIPYLIQGVNDWQPAFEQAGFKNAIYGLEAPANDSSWSLDDARHNIIVYKPSGREEVRTPQIDDPRSGEILETHVNWYHNVQELLHDLYMIQAGPNDPGARKMQFDDELMGQLIRFVCSRQVGHTLGLQDNLLSSSLVPVDSLRSKRYVDGNGYCPSIMDNTWFNYVAQPEDGFDRKNLIPRIGVYDKWAIEWGYKWLPDLGSKEEEETYLNQWVVNRLEKDKRLSFGNTDPNPSWFLEESWGFNPDPTRQAEDLGDDAVKAGYYGIKNLKRVVPQLKEWAKVPNEDYKSLTRLNTEVFRQYKKYLDQATMNIGGFLHTERTVEEETKGLDFSTRARQKAAVQFLQQELFTPPTWLMDKEIFQLSAGDVFNGGIGYMAQLHSFNKDILGRIVSNRVLQNLMLAQLLQPDNAYTPDELLTDLETGIWKELSTKAPVDQYRRDLQKLYIDDLITGQLEYEKAIEGNHYNSFARFDARNTDINPIIKEHLRGLLARIDAAIPGSRDDMTKYHLIELKDRIRKALYDREETEPPISNAGQKNYPLNNWAVNGDLMPDNNDDGNIQQQETYRKDEYTPLEPTLELTNSSPVDPKTDTIKVKLKPYKEVITSKAITQKGMFTVHKVDDKYYFEIADSLLGRDILVVNRISKGHFDGSHSGHAGDWIGEGVIQLSKGPGNKLFLKQVSYDVRSSDSSQNGLYKAVQNSNLQPIVAALDIVAISPDSTGLVVDMTDYISSDNDVLFFRSYTKAFYTLEGVYQPDKSYPLDIRSFPLNVEIKTVKTYKNRYRIATFELNSSMVLLPSQPMQPRYRDDRIGYFVDGYYNYDPSKPVGIDWMITRWRLEPKDGDIEKYKRGELVEPKKPIVYYIDPATPKKWVPYLIKGVNAWQPAFEQAGFKNAIYALEVPAGDSTWSMDDARHNVIIYKPSRFENASGPQVHDPRSGEILETHINWYHGVQKILHDWYMVQAGITDSGARKMQFDDELMGRLMQFVCTHEVGHTLGLMHNFGASSTIPVDSIRSKSYVDANGYCPSIMDYARFNYVAQPEDGFDRKELIPNIGAYDKWAIEWGYKWLPDLGTKEEKIYMNKWITGRLEKDKRLWYGPQTDPGTNTDSRRQNEDIGDDAVKASRYGIQNLKRIIPQLKDWTKIPNGDYESLTRLTWAVTGQYRNYLGHVITSIGGLNWTEKMVEEKGAGVSFPSPGQQKAAVQFLQDELFTTPEWLMNNEIYRLTAGTGNTYWNLTLGWQEVARDNWTLLTQLQMSALYKIISYTTYYNLMLAESLQPGNTYSFDELLTDFETGIWKELKTNTSIDMYRRDLQKLYVDRLIGQLDPLKKASYYDQSFASDVIITDVYPIIKAHLRHLLAKINSSLPSCKDKMTKAHLTELSERIKKALYHKKTAEPTAGKKDGETNAFNLYGLKAESLFTNKPEQKGCWDDNDDWWEQWTNKKHD